jgi:energy-coupling factor transporter ATP-binding protein EcfA2
MRKIKKKMEKVKYYLPGIKVKSVSAYCRLGEVATIRQAVDVGAVKIQYDNGDIDTARIGHDGNYDLEFVENRDELLQNAMENYPKGCSFQSLVGTEITNFEPLYPKWGVSSMDKACIYIQRKSQDGTEGGVMVYEDGQWAVVTTPGQSQPKYSNKDSLYVIPMANRSRYAYCNVKPDNDVFIHGTGGTMPTDKTYNVTDSVWNSEYNQWFYEINESGGWWSEDSLVITDEKPQSQDSTEFPIEGQCKTITPELETYLRSTRTPEGDPSQKDKAKAVCWNQKGYWYVSRSSQKQEYSIDYLSQFFTQIPTERPMAQQQFEFSPQGGFQLTLPPEIVGAALKQATETHFRETEKKFEKHREDVTALVEKKKQMIETELYEKFEKTISCEFVEFKTKVVEDYLTSKQIVIELGQDKKYEFSLDDKHEQLPKMVTFLQLFKQAMIVGPSGSGKSTMAKQAADVMGLRYGSFSCNLEASKSELVGFANIDGYVESSFLDFYENGGVFLIDEYDSMSPSIAVVLNAAFDRTGILAVPNRKGKTIAKKHKDFYCILAGNTWGSGSVEYQGREMQDAAFLDRFKMCRIFIDYDPQLEKNIAGKHYKFFTKVRNYVTKKVDGENFSTRSMYDATVLLQNGFVEKDILTMMSEHWDEALRRDLFKTVGIEYTEAA